MTSKAGIGEFIKVADNKGSKNKFKDTKRIDDADEDDYKATYTNSVYPQCSGDKAHVCRFSNEQISKFTQSSPFIEISEFLNLANS